MLGCRGPGSPLFFPCSRQTCLCPRPHPHRPHCRSLRTTPTRYGAGGGGRGQERQARWAGLPFRPRPRLPSSREGSAQPPRRDFPGKSFPVSVARGGGGVGYSFFLRQRKPMQEEMKPREGKGLAQGHTASQGPTAGRPRFWAWVSASRRRLPLSFCLRLCPCASYLTFLCTCLSTPEGSPHPAPGSL